MAYGDFDVASHLFATPNFEDGDVTYRVAFFVVASTPRGDRIGHGYSFNTEKEAEALLARIKTAVKVGRTLDLRFWHQMDPVYGSKAYQELDALGYFKALEEQGD